MMELFGGGIIILFLIYLGVKKFKKDKTPKDQNQDTYPMW